MSSEEKKYLALAEELRQSIKSGDYGKLGRLPTISELVERTKFGRSTVQQALQVLQSEGIVVSRNKSYYVSVPPMRISGAPLFDKYLERQGFKPEVDNIINPELAQMPQEIAEIFGQDEGIHFVHRMRRHGVMGAWIRLEENWYPKDLAESFLEEMHRDPNLNVAGRIRETKGLSIEKIKECIIGRLPTNDELRLLAITRNTPVQDVKRTFLSRDSHVILFNRTILVSAYFYLESEYPLKRG